MARDGRDDEGDLSDGDLAEALCATQLNADGRYVATWGSWLFWAGARWVVDVRLEHYTRVYRFLRERADRIVAGAEAANDPERLEIAKRAAKSLKSAAKAHAVLTMCQRSGDVPAVVDQFDAGLMLLGTPVGTVDLATGDIRGALRGDYITLTTAVAPAPRGTPAPRWTQFLGEVFERDAAVIAFMQRALGYALTGQIREQKFFFLHGGGRNGKGVLMQTVAGIMGEYARSVSSSLFVVQNGSEHPTAMAQLRGPRLVTAAEIPEGSMWNEVALKDLTGGDKINARVMRGDPFTFVPQLTLFISGNSKPRFAGMNVAMRERFLLVPFRAKFTDENGKRDPDLGDTLREEWPAILSWLIEGAVEWNRRGLAPPERILEASTAYLDEEDSIKAFVEECMVQDMLTDTAMADIYPRFKAWHEARGVQRPPTQNAMTRRLGDADGLTVLRRHPTGSRGEVNCLVGWRLGP